MCTDIPRSPCATIRNGFIGEPAQKKDKIGDSAWLISSIALIVLGTLSMTGTLPLGMTAGGILTGVGTMGLLGFSGVGITTICMRGICKGGMALAHQD